jgi:ABC-type polysaccharide/polyol phosphate transport system ATPase subunit
LKGNCHRFLLFRDGGIEEHDDFEEVYFRYKETIGEQFESKAQMVAEMQ